MKGKIEGVEYTPEGARLQISFSSALGRERWLNITLPTDRVLSEADIQKAIEGEVVKLALMGERIRAIKDLLGTEVDLPDDLL